MEWFNLAISLGGGLALFLFGMGLLGNSLEKLSSGRLEKTLEKLTNSVWKGVLLGIVITAAIQSSSATTVIAVGLVNAGVLKLRGVIGVIMGANVGTTVTAQILRLGDLENSENANLFLSLLKPTTLAPIIGIIGILFYMTARKNKTKDIGTICLAFSVLFTGMLGMEAAVKPLAEVPQFAQLFASLSNPLFGVLAGAAVTAIIQSSSASVGILQALSATGAITYSSAIPIILGQNIGTCVTSLLSSIGTSKNAKRTAMVHLYFNIIGSAVFLAAVYGLKAAIGFSFWDMPIDKGGIANFHTVFNLSVTLLFIPFAGLLEKLARLTIRTGAEEEDEATSALDERLLVSPGLALSQCETLLRKMSSYAKKNMLDAFSLFDKHNSKLFARIAEQEETIDRMEDRLETYLQKLTARELSEVENKEISYLLRVILEVERIGDYAMNVADRADMLQNRQAEFSETGNAQLRVMFSAIEEIITLTDEMIQNDDIRNAAWIEPLEETIDQLEDLLKEKHLKRLKKGACNVEAGIIYLETLTDLERVGDHCSNISVYRLAKESSAGDEEINLHAFLHNLHEEGGDVYQKTLDKYNEKYLSAIQ